MSSRRIYFAFPDRALHYECVPCQALCCKGRGIAARVDRELVTLTRLKPSIARWAVEQRGNMLYLGTPEEGCWFLDGQGRCGVELTAGRAHKPSVCRAFPFNRTWALGDTWLVAPHYLCPLSLKLDGDPDVQGDHARVQADLLDSGWLEQPLEQRTLAAYESAQDFLRTEQQLRDSCQSQLTVGRLDRILQELTPAADQAVAEIAELFAWTAPVPSVLEPYFLALAATWSLEHSQLPLEVRRRALLLARLHVAHALSEYERAPSLKRCYNLWNANKPLLELLALGHAPMPQGLLVDTGQPSTLLAGAVVANAAQRGESVVSALSEGMTPLPLEERFALTQALGSLLQQRQRSA